MDKAIEALEALLEPDADDRKVEKAIYADILQKLEELDK